MKTNVIIQNTVPSAILKKVIGTIWIRPVNASLYTINEHGHMHRSTFNVNSFNLEQGNNPTVNIIDDLFLNGLREKMLVEGIPTVTYAILMQKLKGDAAGIFFRNYLHSVTNKPYDFYEVRNIAGFMRDMFLSAAKLYDSTLNYEAPIDSDFLRETKQLEDEQWGVFNTPEGEFYGERRKKLSALLLMAADVCRVSSQFPDGTIYITPTIYRGEHNPMVTNSDFFNFSASIYDRIAAAVA